MLHSTDSLIIITQKHSTTQNLYPSAAVEVGLTPSIVAGKQTGIGTWRVSGFGIKATQVPIPRTTTPDSPSMSKNCL